MRRMFAKKRAGVNAVPFPRLRARLPAVPDGQSASTPCSPTRHAQNRRANSEALLPRRGKQRRLRTPAAYPCPAGQGCVIPPARPTFPSLAPKKWAKQHKEERASGRQRAEACRLPRLGDGAAGRRPPFRGECQASKVFEGGQGGGTGFKVLFANFVAWAAKSDARLTFRRGSAPPRVRGASQAGARNFGASGKYWVALEEGSGACRRACRRACRWACRRACRRASRLAPTGQGATLWH